MTWNEPWLLENLSTFIDFSFRQFVFFAGSQTLLSEEGNCSIVDEKGAHDDKCKYYQTTPEDSFRCNICGQIAEFIIHLELVKERSNYTIMESDDNMPFYLCKVHEYVYKKMRTSIDLKDYFDETIRVNR